MKNEPGPLWAFSSSSPAITSLLKFDKFLGPWEAVGEPQKHCEMIKVCTWVLRATFSPLLTASNQCFSQPFCASSQTPRAAVSYFLKAEWAHGGIFGKNTPRTKSFRSKMSLTSRSFRFQDRQDISRTSHSAPPLLQNPHRNRLMSYVCGAPPL